MNLARFYAEQICPACGYKLNFKPWTRSPEDRPCPCCGVHFGLDDDPHREATYKRWRRYWVAWGKRWWSAGPAPDNFSPDEQIANLERLLIEWD